MTVQVAFGARDNRIGAVLGAIAFAALAAAPWWGGRDDLRLLSEIYTYVALASLWNLLAGYAGLVSVGQQAYVGLGAYTLFALAILFGISPLWAIPLAGLGVVHGGLFWFFTAGNPELLLKVLDACALNQSFWVFSSAATNVGFTVTVTDTLALNQQIYTNEDQQTAAPLQDLNALSCP